MRRLPRGRHIDIAHDNADNGRKIDCPLRVLWGREGAIEAHFDCLDLWRQRASRVEGEALAGGHYLAEEVPAEIITQSLQFFTRNL